MSRSENRTVLGDCGHLFAAQVWQSVNTSDPALVERFLEGTLNYVKCPVGSCGELTDVRSPFVFHDVAIGLMVFIYNPDMDDDDPLGKLDPRLREAIGASGAEMISADSFEAVRDALQDMYHPDLLPRLRQQHRDWTDGKLCAEYIRDRVENSEWNGLLREVRRQTKAAEAESSQGAFQTVGPLPVGHFLIGSPCSHCNGVFEQGDIIALLSQGTGYEGVHARHVHGDAKELSYQELEELVEQLDGTADDVPCADETGGDDASKDADLTRQIIEKHQAKFEQKQTEILARLAADLTHSPEQGSQLRRAFVESSAPDAPAPPGWWVLPTIGLVIGIALALRGGTLATLLAVVIVGWMLMLLVGGAYRANRKRRL